MKLVMAAALWGLFSVWLLFPHVGVARMLITAAGTLMWLEFLTVVTWGFASEHCVERPCSPLAETARTAAVFDLPLLGTAVVALAVAHGVRQRRAGTKVRA